MRILAVDTSSNHGSVCLVEDGEVLGQVSLACSIQHSERLFRSLEFLLEYVPFGINDIDVYAAARGPGSFTGLRIGLAAMEGFAAANKRRGIGISTLAALAWKCGPSDSILAPVIDARRGEVFGALYRRIGDQLVEQLAPAVMPAAQWFTSLPDLAIDFCGDGAQRYRELIAQERWSLRKMDLFLAATIAEMATTGNSGPLEPLYVRRTDAELLRERHHESLAGPNTKG